MTNCTARVAYNKPVEINESLQCIIFAYNPLKDESNVLIFTSHNCSDHWDVRANAGLPSL